MAVDIEQGRGDQPREMRARVAAAVVRQAGGGALRLTPPLLLATLCASALTPLAMGEPDVAIAQVIAGVGVNILSQVINESIAALRLRTKKPEPQDAERELSERIAGMLDTGNAQARRLRIEIAGVLREIDAAGLTLEAMVKSGNRALQAQIAGAFTDLSAEFTEFGFLLSGIEDAADRIQRELQRQAAERRYDRDLARQQSDQLVLIRDELARLRQARHHDPEAVRWVSGSPYRGLSPFEADHEPIFYGREQLTARLVGKVGERLTGPGLVMVTGASGAGKSSLVRAGLLPALSRGRLAAAGSRTWPRLLFTPTGTPLDEFAVHLAAAGKLNPVTTGNALAEEPGRADLLVRQCLLATQGGPERLVIIVDQFEEIFTLAGAGQREAFVTALSSIVATPTGLVVVVMRGDFTERCADHPVLAEALMDGQFVVGRTTRSELRRVITGPAAAAGLTLEPGLTETILDELGPAAHEAGALPLLSQAMLMTWENRDGDQLTIRGYGRGGGVELAVRTSAEAVFEGLTPERQALAQRLFHRMTLVSHDGHLARRRLSRAELYDQADPADVDAVLDAFAARRLIVLTETGAEISHDCLLHAWPRLRDLLREDQAVHALHGQLTDVAAVWDGHGRDASFLYLGIRLASLCAARDVWAAQPDRFPPVTETAREFLDACERAAARAERSVVRRRWLTRLVVAGMTVLALAAVTGAVAAVRSAGDAETGRLAALSRQLAAQSLALAVIDPVTSARLAYTAFNRADTAEARHAVLNALASPLRGILTGHTDAVKTVAVSADGALVATAGEDGTARLWDAVTHRQIGAPLTGNASGVALSDGGALLATTGVDTVGLWDIATHRQVGALRSEDVDLSGQVVFGPDAATVVTAGTDGTAQRWDVVTRQPIGRPVGRSRADAQTALSRDGRLLAVAGAGGPAVLWDVTTGKRAGDPLLGDTGNVRALAFSPDGGLVCAIGTDGTIVLWDVHTQKQLGDLVSTSLGALFAVAFSPDGATFAVTGGDTVELWDTATRRRIGAPLVSGVGPVEAMAFDPAGTTLITAGGKGAVRLWDVGVHRQTGAPLRGHEGPLLSLAFDGDRGVLATGGADGTVRLWDVATREQIDAPFEGHTGAVYAMAFSPEGTLLSTAGSAGEIQSWEVRTRRQTGAVLRTGYVASSVRFSLDGTLVATIGSEGDARVWDLPARKRIGAPVSAPEVIETAAFSPDTTRLVTAESDGTVRLWDAVTREQIGPPLLGHDRRVSWVEFSPDGTKLATAGFDGTTRLWEVATGRQRGTPLAGTGRIASAQFSPDGTRLATAGFDGTARLWDVATGAQIGAPLVGHTDTVQMVAFNREGTVLATVGNDATARLWDVAQPSDPAAICAVVGTSLSEEEWARYLPGEDYRRLC
ncbi:NACHT and WD repeat domain-containing protein [Herbidospora mongoliensis]|uniref:NACHT and WD repeat domain-containing protein n=1 Tax=Herbidospora mongoliensis TaxID=688067 RepID=UPI000A472EEC|nr:AAA family ATPase [Herbidospora mongoliensis]